jgi:hypothetical protein
MTLPTRMVGAVAVAATTVSLAIPGVAGAKAGDKTFQQTYQIASKLCARVAAGTEGKHLKRFAASVMADCTTLESSFAIARSRVLAARATLAPQIAADRAVITAACPLPNDQQPACVQTRTQFESAIDVLRRRLVHAVHHYYRAVEAARDRFWNAIREIPGERHIFEDLPIPVLDD